MKNILLTFSTLFIMCVFSAKIFAQRDSGGYSEGNDPVTQLSLTNYPNPVGTSTTVKYGMPVAGKISLKVYNSLGQFITTLFEGDQKSGCYTIDFNASTMAQGIYVCRFAVVSGDKENVLTRKMNIVQQ